MLAGIAVWKLYLILTLAAFALLLPAWAAAKKGGAAAGRTWVVSQGHPRASDDGPGTKSAPLATISAAAARAQPGETVVVHVGTYRERVAPARGGTRGKPIVYRAAAGERVVIQGSETWQPKWDPVKGQKGVFFGMFERGWFGGYNPYRLTLKKMGTKLSLGQVFVDGEALVEVESMEEVQARPGSWTVTEKKTGLVVHFPPSPHPVDERHVEISLRGRIFAPHKRGLGHIHVRGFVMEHCANQYPAAYWDNRETAQAGALSTRSGHHWVIEGNTIRHAKTIGLDCGSESRYDLEGHQPVPKSVGHHVIRGNVIRDNGACGIAGWRQKGTRIAGNVVVGNNRLGFRGGEEAGIKVQAFADGVIEGNRVQDNDAVGIWLENGWPGARVTRNVVVGNREAGISVELGDGPCLVDNNVVAFTRAGHGLCGQDASSVTAAHNLTLFNANFGVWMHVATDRRIRARSGGKQHVSTSNNRVVNNLILGDHRGAVSLPFPSARAKNNRSDRNLVASSYELTSMDAWEAPLGKPLFLVNPCKGRVRMKALVDALSHALAKDEAGAALHPNTRRWAELPYLSFREWRHFSGNDLESRIPRVFRAALPTRRLELSFAIDDAPWRLDCRPVKGVGEDFFAAPTGKQKLLPGPFQSLQEGENHFVLWPAAGT